MKTYTASELLRYPNHPLAAERVSCPKCKWLTIAPAYPGDYFDCTNPDCGHTIAPTPKQIQRMIK